MTAAAVDRLIAESEALVRALDAQELGALDTAHGKLRDALAEVAAAGGWRRQADLRPRVEHALRLLEGARGRVNFLADSNRRRFDRLSALTGAPRTSPYGRQGRLR